VVIRRLFFPGLIALSHWIDKSALLPPYCSGEKTGGYNRMCDDFIHQGLTHDPTVSRQAFGLGAAATAVALYTGTPEAGMGQGDRD
jgi:hypothetical protein